MKKSCTFCQIAKNKIKSHKIYENKYSFAFLDVHPVNPGHILVIPKMHVANFYDLEEKYFYDAMKVVRKLSKVINKTLKPKKVGLVVAGFDVDHTHIHIIPMKKYYDITSKSLLEGKRSNPSYKELEDTAKKVIRNFN